MEDYIAEFTQIDVDIAKVVDELDGIIFSLDEYNEKKDTKLFAIIDRIESVSSNIDTLRSKIDNISNDIECSTKVNYENVDIKDYIHYLQFSDTNGGLNSLIDELKFVSAIN